MFKNGQKVVLRTYDELAEQFGCDGEDNFYDILTDPPITDAMEKYLGTEVTIKEKCEGKDDAYYIEEDEEGWGFPSVAFVEI